MAAYAPAHVPFALVAETRLRKLAKLSLSRAQRQIEGTRELVFTGLPYIAVCAGLALKPPLQPTRELPPVAPT